MNLQEICTAVCDVARNAGSFMQNERENFTSDKIEIKGHNDFVSYVDKATEELVVKQLMPLIADAGFLTEENTVKQENKRYTWVIDPIDGTTNYVHGLHPYCVSIGLTENDEPILGVVYLPVTNECFYAFKNGGAFLNGKQIHASDTKKIADSLFITGFPYKIDDKIDFYMNVMRHLTFNSHGIRRLGSAAADLVYVAAGYCDAFYQTGLKPWDMAAGIIIAKEAGATVTDFNGNSALFSDSVAATSAGIYNEVIALLKSYL